MFEEESINEQSKGRRPIQKTEDDDDDEYACVKGHRRMTKSRHVNRQYSR